MRPLEVAANCVVCIGDVRACARAPEPILSISWLEKPPLTPNGRRQRRPGHNGTDLDGEVPSVWVCVCVCTRSTHARTHIQATKRVTQVEKVSPVSHTFQASPVNPPGELSIDRPATRAHVHRHIPRPWRGLIKLSSYKQREQGEEGGTWRRQRETNERAAWPLTVKYSSSSLHHASCVQPDGGRTTGRHPPVPPLSEVSFLSSFWPDSSAPSIHLAPLLLRPSSPLGCFSFRSRPV